jgi:hypothetical protein
MFLQRAFPFSTSFVLIISVKTARNQPANSPGGEMENSIQLSIVVENPSQQNDKNPPTEEMKIAQQ